MIIILVNNLHTTIWYMNNFFCCSLLLLLLFVGCCWFWCKLNFESSTKYKFIYFFARKNSFNSGIWFFLEYIFWYFLQFIVSGDLSARGQKNSFIIKYANILYLTSKSFQTIYNPCWAILGICFCNQNISLISLFLFFYFGIFNGFIFQFKLSSVYKMWVTLIHPQFLAKKKNTQKNVYSFVFPI